MAIKNILVPDIGSSSAVPIIEILVKVGDKVKKEDSLLVLESEKASMEIPAPDEGVIKEIKVNVGDKVSEGHLLMVLETQAEEADKAQAQSQSAHNAPKANIQETIYLPDLGGASGVGVIEVNVKPGDTVSAEQTIITLEGEKATMEIPSPKAGTVEKVLLKVGDKVKQGDAILELTAQAEERSQQAKTMSKAPATSSQAKTTQPMLATKLPSHDNVYASPSVRRLARELGIDLNRIKGSGDKGRITKDDLYQFIKAQLQGGGAALPEAPSVDFSKYGEIEVQALSRIKKLSAKNLHRNWLLVPHVTQFDEVDITEMEAYRKLEKEKAEKQGVRLTPLVFIMKAVVSALKAYPQFNASLAPNGEDIILKKYYHLGVAVDTPNGLVVPVFRDVDKKDIYQLAKELAQYSEKARNGQLTPADMQGSTFTISSLGGIGGTAFTPIVNMPDVAILGVSKAQMKPIYEAGQFIPKLMLPLSLSYDHRVIDGADGARFSAHLAKTLSEFKQLL